MGPGIMVDLPETLRYRHVTSPAKNIMKTAPEKGPEHTSSIRKRLQHRRLLLLCVFLFAGADAIISLAIVKHRFFPFSINTPDYLGWIEDELSKWTGRLFWLSVIVIYVLLPLMRGKPVSIPEFSGFLERAVNALARALNRMQIAAAVVGAATTVCLLVLWYYVSLPPAPPPAGRLVFSSNRESTKLYAVLENSIVKFDQKETDQSGHLRPLQVFPLTDAGNVERIAVPFDEKHIYVTDSNKGLVHVIDTESASDAQHLSADRTAGPLTMSGDGKKLYVGIVGPIPEGRILVFSTDSLARVGTISHVGCPVDLYAAPRAHLLFVATQCGGGHDPLYIIDTRTDTEVGKVPDLAVGSRVVATPNGSTVFVSTGDKLHIIRDRRVQTSLSIPVSALAVTPDGRWLLVGTRTAMLSFDVATGRQCKRVDLEGDPQEIAVARNDAVYAIMQGRLFVTDLAALECQN